MAFLFHWFGIHLTILQISLLVLAMVVIVHFILLSKDFRTFVVLGLFGFAGSFGKMMGILLGKGILAFFRGIKIAFHYQIYAFQELAKAIRDEAHGIPDDFDADDF